MDNYPDSKCCYGYMTLCDDCRASIAANPRLMRHVDVDEPIDQEFPKFKCEYCGKVRK